MNAVLAVTTKQKVNTALIPNNVFNNALPLIQTNLAVNRPADCWEREADKIATLVMNKPPGDHGSHTSKPKGSTLSTAGLLSARDASSLHRKESSSQPSHNAVLPHFLTDLLRSENQPLDQTTRSFFEDRLGHNFANVRVYNNNQANQAAKTLNARAFTYGNHIAFGSGEYQPASTAGGHLLAHELAHVIQQTAGSRTSVHAPDNVNHRLSRWSIQRQDATFVSTAGEQGYLNNAVSFHNAWGYPNVRRAGSLEEIINWVSANVRGVLSRLRIVTHANNTSIITPVIQSYQQPTNQQTVEEFSQGLMPMLARHGHVTDESLVDLIFTSLRAEPANRDSLQRLGADQNGPAAGSLLHGLVWWLVDRHMVQNSHVQSGRRRVPFPNQQGVIRQINTSINLLRRDLIIEVSDQPSVEYAMVQRNTDLQCIENGVNAYLANYLWDSLTQAEAQNLGGQIIRESQPIQQAVTTNTFETNLETVRSLIGLTTRIEIRGCRIGQDQDFLRSIQQLFGGGYKPTVSAPDWYQYFGHPSYNIVNNTDQQLENLWNNQDIQDAFCDWWNVIRPNAIAPDLGTFKDYLRSGEIFPATGTLIGIFQMAADAMVNWLVRNSYYLTASDAIRQRFFANSLATSMQNLWLDWLQDQHPNPTQILYAADPRYNSHIVEVAGELGDFNLPRTDQAYA